MGERCWELQHDVDVILHFRLLLDLVVEGGILVMSQAWPVELSFFCFCLGNMREMWTKYI